MSRVVNRFKDGESLAKSAAEAFVTKLAVLISEKPLVNIMLTGGTIGIATLSAIAEREDAHLLDWSKVHIWWGDERFVAADSTDRNAVQARKAMLDRLPVTEANIHEFAANDGLITLDEAASLFAAELASIKPHFDMAFVGMGPDGHICSLFPGKNQPEQGALVIAEHYSPKPPPQRLSFSYEAMNAVDELWFVVAGADKSSAVATVFGDEPESLPAGRVRGVKKTIWFVDQTAATQTWGC
ncbi:MAG: 6-phosphogluconolactonase [Rhodoluna sp.]|nr:6-phosphogluconolactonase [Rhodoluna sp.]MBP6186428.1 6-phosphogluconolactonase [Rhodoluna sp.]